MNFRRMKMIIHYVNTVTFTVLLGKTVSSQRSSEMRVAIYRSLRLQSIDFSCMINGLPDKKVEALQCQCELQEYQLLYFICVYHTDLFY